MAPKADKLPNGLTPADLERFETSYLRLLDIAPYVCRVDSDGGYNLVWPNERRTEDFSGLIYSYWHPKTGTVREYVLRLDYPVGKMKYVGPKGRTNLFFIPLGVRLEWLKDISIPIVFCEGEKKCLAMWRIAQENARDGKPLFIPIGLRGVYGWKGVTGKESGPNGERESTKGPLNDFDFFEWEARRAFILFDSNIHSPKLETRQSVRGARRGLAHHLHYVLQARVFFAEMTPEHFERGLNGPDDLAGADGPDAVLELLDTAQLAVKPAEPPKRERLTPEQRRERAEAWRKAVSPEKRAAITLGATQTRYLALLWASAGLSPKSRDLLFSLEAMLRSQPDLCESDELDFYYADLYPLLYKLDGNEFERTKAGGRILKSGKRERIRERFAELEAEQEACGITFADFRHGRQDGEGKNLPSRVRLRSRGYVAEVMILAEEEPGYGRHKKESRERAFARFVTEQSGKAYVKKYPPRIDRNKKIADGWKRVQGNLDATIGRMRENGEPEETIWRTAAEFIPPDLIEFIKQGGDLSCKEREVTPTYGGEASPQTSPPGVATEICPECGQPKPPKWVTSESHLNPEESTDDFAGFQKTCTNQQPEYDPVAARIWARVEARARGEAPKRDTLTVEEARAKMDDFPAMEGVH